LSYVGVKPGVIVSEEHKLRLLECWALREILGRVRE